MSADETDVRLKYVYQYVLTNIGGGSTGKTFNPNAAYDVDPSLGSTSTDGYDAYALLYTYYRVIGYRYTIEVVNNETSPVIAYCFNTNTAVSGSALDLQAGGAYSATAMLGPANSGSSKHTFRGSVQCSKLLGSIEAETDASMRSLTTGVPSDLLYLSVWAQTSTIGTLTNGVSYMVKITMDIRFYGRTGDRVGIELMQTRIDQIRVAREEAEHRKKVALKKLPPTCQ